ncbi:MAG: 2-phosphosulfolactate phosphatase [Chloroflexi bacterium]|nr:2-phosphosulfolactate phosphatase [Chloroflexota bacterium]
MRVDLTILPPPASPTRETCLVVDVLRATSVMAVLFGRGIEAVYPAATIEEGRVLRARLAADGSAPMLCGEVDALPPEGYDYGNSPGEFMRMAALPANRAVVATTNGTPALVRCASAPLVIAAAPLNAGAATRLALAAGHDVLVVCAGTAGLRSEDDRLAGGLLVARLVAAGAEPTPAAASALADFRAVATNFTAALRDSGHGRRLVALGFDSDIALCAQSDRYERAGTLRFEDGIAVLRPAEQEGMAS